MPVPVEPVVFSKFSSAINDPYGVVVLDEETQVHLLGGRRVVVKLRVVGEIERVVVKLRVVGEIEGVVVRLCVCILFVLTPPCVTQGCMLEEFC